MADHGSGSGTVRQSLSQRNRKRRLSYKEIYNLIDRTESEDDLEDYDPKNDKDCSGDSDDLERAVTTDPFDVEEGAEDDLDEDYDPKNDKDCSSDSDDTQEAPDMVPVGVVTFSPSEKRAVPSATSLDLERAVTTDPFDVEEGAEDDLDEDYDPKNDKDCSSDSDDTQEAPDMVPVGVVTFSPSEKRVVPSATSLDLERAVTTDPLDVEEGKNPTASTTDSLDATATTTETTANENLPQNDVRPTARPHKRTGKMLTKKRCREPDTWKCNIRKKQRQSGLSYIDSRGKTQPRRKVQLSKSCTQCRFKCNKNFSLIDRTALFEEFWALTDNEKRHFYSSTTQQAPCQRKRTSNPNNRKKNSIQYYLPCHGQNIRVCKKLYLSTIDVSQKRITNYHSQKHNPGGTPTQLKWGRQPNYVVSDDIKEDIRNHIRSIPRIDSHYCRKDTNKEYISTWGMNVTALYRKYREKCANEGKTPGKLHLYRTIFNSEFNIAFHFPKKDRCDKCEEMKANLDPTDENLAEFAEHIRGKTETEQEREKDRADNNSFCVSFDLENVFALPRANISSFFYRRKLNVYHMTGHCSVDKQTYGALWHEAKQGRNGNDIASAVMKILHEIVNDHQDDPRIQYIKLWSDSCVPQNRNKMFSTAVSHFLETHPQVKIIEQKFCQPGHSSIQEVDNLHSRIEHACGPSEIYSPLGLLRTLKEYVNKHHVKQMRDEDFKDFSSISMKGRFEKIPYTKVKSLKYESTSPKEIKYKTSFVEEFKTEAIWNFDPPKTREKNSRQKVDIMQSLFKSLKTVTPSGALTKAKKSDIKAMLKFMPEDDKKYMKALV